MKITPLNQNIYNKTRNVTFGAKWHPTNNAAYRTIADATANGCARLMSTKSALKVADFVNRHTNKKPGLLNTHLIVLGSTLLSGFYIIKTLNNKDMDEKRRKTLALNQTLVYGVSTILAYAFDNWAMKKIDKVADKFVELNKDGDVTILKKFYPLEKEIQKANPQELVELYSKQIEKWKGAFGLAKSIMIGGLVYRFIAPVVVTPIANAISNKLQANKQAGQQPKKA